ncbi:MAG: LacI family transcriptional regulator [Treponemataceae bacterium]|jgi:DNA-binding LacI/PurR family transcriptional regulator|nr:LacI family transcriptional regulator [Treponemataceae bacterium]
MKVTIKELAEKAGVSKTAVSFAFNNPKRISSETYERIMKIAKEIGYSPDPVARILATHQTQTIGLLFPQSITDVFQNPYISELVRGVGAICDRAGLALTLLSPFKGIVEHTIQNAAVDGMIILGVDKYSSVHETFKLRNMPYITIDATVTDEYTNVGIDDKKLAEELMDLLLDNGHTRISFCALKPIAVDITEGIHSTTTDARRNGIESSIKKHNLSDEVKKRFRFLESDTSFSKSYEIAKMHLMEQNRPTAVFCMGDIQALGFYCAAEELGLKIPEDISIVSFDDLPISSIIKSGLTTAHQPGFEKGMTAAELLVRKMNGESCSSVILPAYIENRGSVSKAKEV